MKDSAVTATVTDKREPRKTVNAVGDGVKEQPLKQYLDVLIGPSTRETPTMIYDVEVRTR